MHPDLLARYPDIVRDQLPLLITRKGAMELEVHAALARDAGTGGSFADFAARISEQQHEEYYNAELRYLHVAEERARQLRKMHAGRLMFDRSCPAPNTAPAEFGSYKVSVYLHCCHGWHA